MSEITKREIILHLPTIEIAQAIVGDHNFGYGWGEANARLHRKCISERPTVNDLFIHDYDIVYYKPRWFRSHKRYVLGSIRFYVEQASIGKNVVHHVALRGHGLAMAFQSLHKSLEDYFGKGLVSLHFIADEPRDW